MNFDPKTYWEERGAATEEAVRRLMAIVATALPHTQNDVAELNSQWLRVVREIEAEHHPPLTYINKP